MDIHPLHSSLALVAVALVGALPPLYRRWSHRGLHQLVSISAGIFLGSLFLHLLPELASGNAHAHGAATEGSSSMVPWVALLAGFLLLFVIERVWLQRRGGGGDPHSVLLLATFGGLGLHALTMGLGLSAISSRIDWAFLMGILGHKAAEAFSLAAVMSLAAVARPRALLLLGFFALLTPVGLLVGTEVVASNGDLATVLGGFACGTFLYVAVCDLLPEVFHDTEQSWTKLGWVLLGIGVSALTLPQAEGAPRFALLALMESALVFEEMSVFLLVGFAIAGVLSQVLKPEFLTRHLAGNDSSTVAKAALIGAPLPLCSCSVVPVAVSLRKAGASKGATSSFLIATPETGADSVTVTWALLDPFMTIARPLGAVISAFFTGTLVNFFVNRGFDDETPATESESSDAVEEGACCAVVEHGAPEEASAPTVTSKPTRGFSGRVFHFAFVEMIDDLAGALIAGILLSGVISAAVPATLFEQPIARGFTGMLLMLLIGIPIYVCAAASTPIAASLILKGLSPGAALVFLLASPATNLASLVALSRTMGRRVLALHLVGLSIVTLALGVLVDALYPALGLLPSASAGGEHSLLPGWLTRTSAVVLALLLAVSVLRTRLGVRLKRRFPRLGGSLGVEG